MRMLKTLVLAAALLALAATPALALCAPAGIASATTEGRSYVWTDGWNVYYYYPGVPPVDYLTQTPPITGGFSAVYWQLGAGNLTTGDVGIDSGTYAVPPANWVPFDPAYLGYFPTAAIIDANWAQSEDIDNCPSAPDYCACVLMQDQKDGVGYFAMASGRGVNYEVGLNQGGSDPIGFNLPIILKALPTPTITRIDMDMVTHNLTFNVTVSAPTAGMYELDGCDCGPASFTVYQQIRALAAGAPPDDRTLASGWSPVGTAAMGGSAVFESLCGSADNNVYLAAGLVFDSGFPGAPYPVIVSETVGPVACGPTIAEPKPLQPRIRRHLRDDVPRGERTR